MKKVVYLLFISVCCSLQSFAWGPEGHAIVGRIAMKYVQPDVRENVLRLLGTMSVDTAANWMDIVKSDHDYDFMRSWHYMDFPKGETYKETNQGNLINRLQLTFDELKHKKILCESQVRMDLLMMMHLVGDLSMPLHTGYEDDLGGNKVMVQYDTLKTHNLHWFWDEDIIRLTNITDADCTTYYDELENNLYSEVSFVDWMQDSRSLLPEVYDYEGFMLGDTYLAKNKVTVEKQLLKAGLRLANILNRLFPSQVETLDYKREVSKYKNGIELKELRKSVGQTVAICGRITNVRATAKTTQLVISDENGENEMLAVIFARNYDKYTDLPEKLFRNKNVCVKGKVAVFNRALEILVEDAGDITVL